jgi:hypothetical protein
MRIETSLSLVALALIACAGCETSAPLQNARISFAAPVTLSAASGVGIDGTTSEVRAAFGEWLAARSHGDAVGFEELYDTARFEGIRRARSGIEKRLTWREWEAEQRPALDRSDVPRVSRPVFESWPGGTLDLATASVAFDEERGPRAGEAMRRVLVFGRSPDGKLRIVREELGVASRGDDGPSNTLSRDAKVAKAL